MQMLPAAGVRPPQQYSQKQSGPVRRYFVREVQETQVSQVELFLNSVPILSPLTKEERMRLVDALEEVTYPAGA